jgi:hypothetical protein
MTTRKAPGLTFPLAQEERDAGERKMGVGLTGVNHRHIGRINFQSQGFASGHTRLDNCPQQQATLVLALVSSSTCRRHSCDGVSPCRRATAETTPRGKRPSLENRRRRPVPGNHLHPAHRLRLKHLVECRQKAIAKSKIATFGHRHSDLKMEPKQRLPPDFSPAHV